jgi:signal peptidase II
VRAAATRRAFYAGLSLAVLALDQWTKSWAGTRLRTGPDVDVIPGLLRFTYAENPGIAFSFLSSGTQSTRWGLAAFSSLAALVVIGFAVRTSAFSWRLQTTFALLFAGIVGNLIDRVETGRVIDFIDAYVNTHHWPTFNVADSAISVGAVFLALELFRHEEHASQHEPATPEGG